MVIGGGWGVGGCDPAEKSAEQLDIGRLCVDDNDANKQ
jgi:hypothetical protein